MMTTLSNTDPPLTLMTTYPWNHNTTPGAKEPTWKKMMRHTAFLFFMGVMRPQGLS